MSKCILCKMKTSKMCELDIDDEQYDDIGNPYCCEPCQDKYGPKLDVIIFDKVVK